MLLVPGPVRGTVANALPASARRWREGVLLRIEAMSTDDPGDQHKTQEAQRRSGATVRAAGKTLPSGQKGAPRRRSEAKRQPDEPTSPHHAEHDDPAERAKTAMRKAGERARRVKRPGASGIRGGTSEG
jgi:hypothetical protein